MSYTVQAGDTFWSISQKLGISVDALQAANAGVAAGSLQVGQVLNLPGSGTTKYTIVSGDTLWSIAQKNGISVDALQAANPGIDPNTLQVGQVINIPKGGNVPAPAPVPAPPPPTNGAPPPPTNGNIPGARSFVPYSGPPSNYPDPNRWSTWEPLWNQNLRLMRLHDTEAEIALIRSSIITVSSESDVPRRVILCIIMQETGGNVRAPTTNNGVRNPGLMQSHNGVTFNPADPAGSILQMIRDGTSGTSFGDGLKQCFVTQGNWYAAFRQYNSGSVDLSNLNNGLGATADYVTKTANRLMGAVWNGM
ncbi:hypothetical protein BST61_g9674 [Cercospora zeina]